MIHAKKHRITAPVLLVWFLLGLLLSVAAIQFRLSGEIRLDKFYNTGIRYTVRYAEYNMSYDGCEFGSDNRYHVTAEECTIPIVIHKVKNRHWNYLYVDIRDLGTETLEWNIISYNSDSVPVFETTAELHEGMNEIVLGSEASNQAVIQMKNQQGKVFRINSMQFRRKISYFGKRKVVCMLLFCMAFYTIVTAVLYGLFLKKIRWQKVYRIMDFPVSVYSRLDRLLEKTSGAYSRNTKIRIRRICFTIQIFLMYLTEAYGNYNKKSYYYMYLLLNCALILIIAAVSYEKDHKQVQWKNPLMLFWFLYCLMTILSDILVPGKVQMWTGLVMLVSFGILFYVMAGMKRPLILVYDLIRPLKFCYVLFAGFCLLCRPIAEMAEGRYIGMTISPYSFGMYATVMVVVFLAELDRGIAGRERINTVIANGIGLISALYFLWLSGSRSSFIAGVVCMLLAVVHFCKMGKYASCTKNMFITAAVLLVVAVPTVKLQGVALNHLPQKLGTTVYFPNDSRMLGRMQEQTGGDSQELLLDQLIRWLPADVVYAQEDAAQNKNHILHTAASLDVLSSGRLSIYKEYIARMNLLGHKKDPRIWNVKMRAHNAVLQTGYRYGAFSMIPYVMMMLYMLVYSYRYLKRNRMKKNSYAVFPFYLVVACEGMMMLDNVERNFRYLPWIVFYVLIGLLCNEEQKDPDLI